MEEPSPSPEPSVPGNLDVAARAPSHVAVAGIGLEAGSATEAREVTVAVAEIKIEAAEDGLEAVAGDPVAAGGTVAVDASGLVAGGGGLVAEMGGLEDIDSLILSECCWNCV
eukprot:390748_1